MQKKVSGSIQIKDGEASPLTTPLRWRSQPPKKPWLSIGSFHGTHMMSIYFGQFVWILFLFFCGMFSANDITWYENWWYYMILSCFFFFFFFFNFSAEYGTCSLYLVWLGHGTIVFPSDKKRCSCRSLNTAGWWLQDLWSGGVVVQGNFPLGFSGWFPNLFSREVEVASQKFCQKTGWRKSKPK